jgi:thioredoxin reductase
MSNSNELEVIIIGGSYSGLSAAMALGRSLRNVLIIDSGHPCNIQTPHSHNFLTQDGEKPHKIADQAKAQVLTYPTVTFHEGLAVQGSKTGNGFSISTQTGETFYAKQLIFATGLKDHLPDIPGFAECWGISVVHCPYCHGYEFKNEKTGLLLNGDYAFSNAQLLLNWTKDLTIFTDGKSTLSPEQTEKIQKHGIEIVEKKISHLDQERGQVKQIVFRDESTFAVKAIYSRSEFEQHCKIPEQLGCELTEDGFLDVNSVQKTSVDNIFACGDNANPIRSIAFAVSAGNIAGAVINHNLTEEEFNKRDLSIKN